MDIYLEYEIQFNIEADKELLRDDKLQKYHLTKTDKQ